MLGGRLTSTTHFSAIFWRLLIMKNFTSSRDLCLLKILYSWSPFWKRYWRYLCFWSNEFISTFCSNVLLYVASTSPTISRSLIKFCNVQALWQLLWVMSAKPPSIVSNQRLGQTLQNRMFSSKAIRDRVADVSASLLAAVSQPLYLYSPHHQRCSYLQPGISLFVFWLYTYYSL